MTGQACAITFHDAQPSFEGRTSESVSDYLLQIWQECMILGYTTGVFDLFHVGHVNLLRNAKMLCDKLIVGVSTDDLVGYKDKTAVIAFAERIEVVRSCRYVDVAVAQESMDKFEAHSRYKFDIMMVGDDWYKNPRWKQYEENLAIRGVKIIFLPYTKTTSSTLINETLVRLRAESGGM